VSVARGAVASPRRLADLHQAVRFGRRRARRCPDHRRGRGVPLNTSESLGAQFASRLPSDLGRDRHQCCIDTPPKHAQSGVHGHQVTGSERPGSAIATRGNDGLKGLGNRIESGGHASTVEQKYDRMQVVSKKYSINIETPTRDPRAHDRPAGV
jgi:hypothetical protein